MSKLRSETSVDTPEPIPEIRRIRVYRVPAEIEPDRLRGTMAVVIDILRATTTITTALAHGCRCIIPVATVSDALKVRDEIGGAECLLAGERGGRKIENFDLGNSPLEFSKAVVSNRTIVLTTTNGTKALLASRHASRTIVMSFLNLQAIAEYLLRQKLDVSIVCSGTNGNESLEDCIAAGMLIDWLGHGSAAAIVLDGSAQAALRMARKYRENVMTIFQASPHALYLKSIGFKKDLDFAAQLHIFDIVPIYQDGEVRKLD